MRMLKLLVLAFAAALAAGCVYDYGVGKDFPHLEKSLIVIEGDIIAGGISEVRVSATSKMETTRSASTKAEDYVLREPLCQVWVESAEGEVWPGKDTTYVWGFENYFDRRLLRISYTVDTRDLPVDGEYRLCVSYPDRGEYRSKFKKVLKAPQVESFDFVFAPDTSYINVMLTSRGDNDGARFCRIEYEEWWENRPPLMPNVILYPGRYDLTTLSQPYKDSLYKCFDKFASQKILLEDTRNMSENVVKDKIVTTLYKQQRRVNRLYCITLFQTPLDKEGYDYYKALKSNSEEMGGLYSPYPSEIVGNVFSETFPDEVVIGYVNVCTRGEKRIFLDGQKLELFNWRKCLEMETVEKKYWRTTYDKREMRPYDYLRKLEDGEYVIDSDRAYWGSKDCFDVSRCYEKPDFWPR